MTAADFADALARDPEYRAKVAAQEERAAAIREDERTTLAGLERAGYRASSLAELLEAPQLPKGLPAALLDELDKTTSKNVSQMIVRVLGRATEPFDTDRLARLFEATSDQNLRWVIANTLAEIRPVSLRSWIAQAVRAAEFGKAREMLALALARTSPPSAANPILLELLDTMPGHAALALAESGGKAELSVLQTVKPRLRGWTRTAVGQAISIIQRRLSEHRS